MVNSSCFVLSCAKHVRILFSVPALFCSAFLLAHKKGQQNRTVPSIVLRRVAKKKREGRVSIHTYTAPAARAFVNHQNSAARQSLKHRRHILHQVCRNIRISSPYWRLSVSEQKNTLKLLMVSLQNVVGLKSTKSCSQAF